MLILHDYSTIINNLLSLLQADVHKLSSDHALRPVLDDEFWEDAICTVKREFPSFVFLAEVYWDLEYRLVSLGFDFCIDKTLLDR